MIILLVIEVDLSMVAEDISLLMHRGVGLFRMYKGSIDCEESHHQ